MNTVKFPNRSRRQKKTPAQDNDWVSMLSGMSEIILSGGEGLALKGLLRAKKQRSEAVVSILEGAGLSVGVEVQSRGAKGIFKITRIETIGPAATPGLTALYGNRRKRDGSYSKNALFLGLPKDLDPVINNLGGNP